MVRSPIVYLDQRKGGPPTHGIFVSKVCWDSRGKGQGRTLRLRPFKQRVSPVRTTDSEFWSSVTRSGVSRRSVGFVWHNIRMVETYGTCRFSMSVNSRRSPSWTRDRTRQTDRDRYPSVRGTGLLPDPLGHLSSSGRLGSGLGTRGYRPNTWTLKTIENSVSHPLVITFR